MTRSLRATVLAVLVLPPALAAHTGVAGGSLPGAGPLAVVVALVLAGWWVGGGETAARALLHALAAPLAPACPAGVPLPERGYAAAPGPRPSPRLRAQVRCLGRRGPPVPTGTSAPTSSP